jgi:RND family efflux transporter MFP subunit
MFQLDDRAARADFMVAQARLRVAESALHRAQELLRTGNFPQARLDELTGDSTTATANLAAAQARLDLLTLRAPFDGEVGVFQLAPGSFVQAGAPLVRLSDNSALITHFRVRQALLPRLSPGQRFTISSDALGAGIVLEGQVAVVDAQADQSTRAVEVRGDVRNPGHRLIGGIYVRVELELARREGQLLVPAAALVPGMASDQAFQIRNGEARLVPVRVGVRRDGSAEVLSGLSEGDQVVTVGQFRLQDGGRVRVVAGDEASAVPAATPSAPRQGR